MGGGLTIKNPLNSNPAKPPEEGGYGKICQLCGAYNASDDRFCGGLSPQERAQASNEKGKKNMKGCGNALPAAIQKFPSYAPTLGQPTVKGPSQSQPQTTTYNQPMKAAQSIPNQLGAVRPTQPGQINDPSMVELKKKIKRKVDIDKTWAALDPD